MSSDKKRLVYQVYLGERSKLYDRCTETVASYCEKFGFDHVIQRTPKLMITPDPFTSGRSKEATAKLGYLPIFEKENAFNHIDDYDQILIIDADVWIRGSAPNIFNDIDDDAAFAACSERAMPITETYRQKLINYTRMQYGSLNDVDWGFNVNPIAQFFNMGVMVINCKNFKPYLKGDNAKRFIERPEFKRFVDGVGPWKWSTDQTLLNWWIKKEKVPVTKLTWKYNCLFKGVKDSYPYRAHFVHFFLKDKLPHRGEDFDTLLEYVIP